MTRLPPPHQAALPLHLTLILLPWLMSGSVLRLSKRECESLSSMLASAPPALKNARLLPLLSALASDPLLARAVEAEARSRAVDFLNGVSRYHATAFERNVSEPPVTHRLGASRLLDYGGSAAPDAPAILLIPSLINRYYILDLSSRVSFARYLSAQGLRVFVIDWGTPSSAEYGFDCADYITGRLAPFAGHIRGLTAGPLILGGYCMGGLLALALANLRPGLVDGLACFATPWDFSAPDFPVFHLPEKELDQCMRMSDGCEILPAAIIQMLFHYANPYAFQNKLKEFGRMDPEHPATREFLAAQHWANDGVPMTQGVARDCLIAWTRNNAPARGLWKVGECSVDPRRLKIPSFVALSEDDAIVPSACALPLAQLLPRPQVVASKCGHVGMMVGSRRKRALWEPFVTWIQSQFA